MGPSRAMGSSKSLVLGVEKTSCQKIFSKKIFLERLFLKIIESTKKGKFKLDSNMINLIGCNRENFIKLLNIMNYKYEKIKKNNEEYFTYKPKKYHKIKTTSEIIKNNPFNVLSNDSLPVSALSRGAILCASSNTTSVFMFPWLPSSSIRLYTS